MRTSWTNGSIEDFLDNINSKETTCINVASGIELQRQSRTKNFLLAAESGMFRMPKKMISYVGNVPTFLK